MSAPRSRPVALLVFFCAAAAGARIVAADFRHIAADGDGQELDFLFPLRRRRRRFGRATRKCHPARHRGTGRGRWWRWQNRAVGRGAAVHPVLASTQCGGGKDWCRSAGGRCPSARRNTNRPHFCIQPADLSGRSCAGRCACAGLPARSGAPASGGRWR